MLINTVVLWLRELLPLMVLLSALMAWPQANRRWFGLAIAVGLVAITGLNWQLRWLSASLDGQGLELLYCLSYLLTVIALITLAWRPQWQSAACFAAVLGLMLVHGQKLALYFWVYPRSYAEHTTMGLGMVLGAGISVSVAVLLFFAFDELKRLHASALYFVLGLLAARQMAAVVSLLQQTGWFESYPALWDSSAVIAEQSEYGFFLNALYGYEATPDWVLVTGQVLVFAAVLVARQLREWQR